MTDAAAFLAAIKETPDDDAPRLVYADWLDEHGQPERAEFIRCQIAIDNLNRELHSDEDCGDDRCPGCRERRAWQERLYKVWYAPAKGFVPPIEDDDWQWTIGEPIEGSKYSTGVVRRGFAELITCPADECLANLDAILAEHPVREVTLTTWPLNRWAIEEISEGRAHSPCGELETAVEMHLRVLTFRWPGISFHLPSIDQFVLETNERHRLTGVH